MPPRIDFTSQRLYLDAPLASGLGIDLTKEQANYLLNVLRMKAGEGLLVFNGRDGEWRAAVTDADRRRARLTVGEQTRPQPAASLIWLCFAPVKQARMDYMVQKAVEMGVGVLLPVRTRRTQVELKNPGRLRANIVEAAEQCGVLHVPVLLDEVRLDRMPQVFAGDTPPPDVLRPDVLLPDARPSIILCDEMAEVSDPLAAMKDIGRAAGVAVLIGPEGGFSPEEREMILSWPRARAISLGPRILRADTAAVAALAAVQLALGDWR
jgi:16S rRNA (uracil1498-N3)-methyltransferase